NADAAQRSRAARRTKGRNMSRQNAVEECRVVGDVLSLILGQVSLVVDGLDSANELAGTAIHAFVWVDVQDAIPFVDAIHGAFPDAGLVNHIHARCPDHIGHVWRLGSMGRSVLGPKALSAMD